jgi:hypothetical protein
MVGVNAEVVANGYALGAGLLGLWLFARYPRFGPRKLRSATVTLVCAYCLLMVTGPLTAAVKSAAGPVVMLLAAYLPVLTFAFWAGLRLLDIAVAAVRRFGA